MATYCNKQFSQQQKGEIIAPFAAASVNKSQQRIRNTYNLPFYLSQQDLTVLATIFPEKEIESTTMLRREHPIAAGINFIMNEKFQAMSNTARTKGFKTLCIGGKIHDTAHFDHTTSYADSVTDYHRYLKNAHEDRSKIHTHIATNAHDDQICFNGAQNCDFKATIAYSVDSMYDIPFGDIPIIFDRHNLSELYATMLLPDSVSSKTHIVIEDDPSHWYHISIVGHKLLFYLDDCNPVYQHDYTNLRKYLFTTYIYTPEYIITSEIVRCSHLLKMFRFVKIPIPTQLIDAYNLLPQGYIDSVVQHFQRQIPLINSDVYYVPNMMYKARELSKLSNTLISFEDVSIENGSQTVSQWYSKSFAIPRQVVDKLSKWFLTQDAEKLTFINFAIFLRSVSSRVEYDQFTVINPGWQPTQQVYYPAAMSLYITLLASRGRTMKDLNTLGSEISQEKLVTTTLGQYWENFKKNIASLFANDSKLQDTQQYKYFVMSSKINQPNRITTTVVLNIKSAFYLKSKLHTFKPFEVYSHSLKSTIDLPTFTSVYFLDDTLGYTRIISCDLSTLTTDMVKLMLTGINTGGEVAYKLLRSTVAESLLISNKLTFNIKTKQDIYDKLLHEYENSFFEITIEKVTMLVNFTQPTKSIKTLFKISDHYIGFKTESKTKFEGDEHLFNNERLLDHYDHDFEATLLTNLYVKPVILITPIAKTIIATPQNDNIITFDLIVQYNSIVTLKIKSGKTLGLIVRSCNKAISKNVTTDGRFTPNYFQYYDADVLLDSTNDFTFTKLYARLMIDFTIGNLNFSFPSTTTTLALTNYLRQFKHINVDQIPEAMPTSAFAEIATHLKSKTDLKLTQQPPKPISVVYQHEDNTTTAPIMTTKRQTMQQVIDAMLVEGVTIYFEMLTDNYSLSDFSYFCTFGDVFHSNELFLKFGKAPVAEVEENDSGIIFCLVHIVMDLSNNQQFLMSHDASFSTTRIGLTLKPNQLISITHTHLVKPLIISRYKQINRYYLPQHFAFNIIDSQEVEENFLYSMDYFLTEANSTAKRELHRELFLVMKFLNICYQNSLEFSFVNKNFQDDETKIILPQEPIKQTIIPPQIIIAPESQAIPLKPEEPEVYRRHLSFWYDGKQTMFTYPDNKTIIDLINHAIYVYSDNSITHFIIAGQECKPTTELVSTIPSYSHLHIMPRIPKTVKIFGVDYVDVPVSELKTIPTAENSPFPAKVPITKVVKFNTEQKPVIPAATKPIDIPKIKFTSNIENADNDNPRVIKIDGFVNIQGKKTATRVKVGKYNHSQSHYDMLFDKESTTVIVHTRDTYQQSTAEYYINAANLEGKLGGGTSFAISQMFPKAQKDLDAILSSRNAKKFNLGEVQITGPYVYNNNEVYAIHVFMDGTLTLETHMQMYYFNLKRFIEIHVKPYSTIHTCLLCAGSFGVDELTSYLYFLQYKPENYKLLITFDYMCLFGNAGFANYTTTSPCKQFLGATPGDGHCFYHAISQALHIPLHLIYKQVTTAGIALYDRKGEKAWVDASMISIIGMALHINILVHIGDYIQPYYISRNYNTASIHFDNQGLHYSSCHCIHLQAIGGANSNILTFDYQEISKQQTTFDLIRFNSIHSGLHFSVFEKIHQLMLGYENEDILDISAAPGHLSRDLINAGFKNLINWVYLGPQHCKPFKDLKYATTYKQFPPEGIVTGQYAKLIICDVPGDVIWQSLSDFILQRPVHPELIIKVMLWNADEENTSFLTRCFKIFNYYTHFKLYRNTRAESSEIYIHFCNAHVKVVNEYADFKSIICKWSYDNADLFPDIKDPKNDDLKEKFRNVTFEVTRADCEAFMKDMKTSILDCCRKVHDQFKDHIPEVRTITVSHYGAVAGAGKSYKIIPKLGADFYITSSQANLSDLRATKVIDKNNSATLHTAFEKIKSSHLQPAVVVVDECTRNPKGYYYYLQLVCDKIITVGSSSQLLVSDPQGSYAGTQPSIDWPADKIHTTYRCPSDITRINRKYGIEMYSLGQQSKSIFRATKLSQLDIVSHVMAPTIETKHTFRICNATIDESQGNTFSSTGIVLSTPKDYENVSLTTNIRRFHVMTTRHKNVFIYFEEDTRTTFMQIIEPALQTLTEYNPVSTAIVVDNPLKIQAVQDNIKNIEIGVRKPSLEAIKEILDENLPKAFPEIEDEIIQDNLMPKMESGKIRLDHDLILPTVYNRKGKKLAAYSGDNYCKVYNVTDNNLTIKTMIERYGKNTKSAGYNLLPFIEQMWQGAYKFIDKTKNPTILSFQHKFYATDEELTAYLSEYLERLQIKLNKIVSKDKDGKPIQTSLTDDEALILGNGKIEDLKQVSILDLDDTIKFFMKSQTKYMPKKHWDGVYKSGQGVSSIGKATNIIFCAITRKIFYTFQENLKSNVKFTAGENLQYYKDWCKDLLSEKPDHNVYDNDVTQWDASNSDVNIFYDAQMFDLVFNPNICQVEYQTHRDPLMSQSAYMYAVQRMKWKQIMHNKTGMAVISGKMKQFSGQQHTLYGNTINNMSLCGIIYDIDDLYLAMYQGDDSQVRGKVQLDTLGLEKVSAAGFKCKIAEDINIGEYVGYVIGKNAWMPDLMRRAAKTYGKMYQTQEKFEESIVGLADTLSVVTTLEEMHAGIAYSKYYYDRHTGFHLSEEQLQTIFDFIYTLPKLQFCNLQNTTTRTDYYF
jgi:hypothetical protein